MSVKLLKYLLVIILMLSTALVSADIVNATCYISRDSCSDTQPTTSYVSVPDNELYPFGSLCYAAFSWEYADGVIGYPCIKDCCCDSTNNIGFWPMTRGYCNYYHYVVPIGSATNQASCTALCAPGTGGDKFNFSGYVLRSGVPTSNVLVTLNGGTSTNITNNNGRFNFLNVDPGTVTMSATIGACTGVQTFTLSSNNQIQNISVNCPVIKLNGNVTGENNERLEGVNVVATDGHSVYSTISSDTGYYELNIPWGTVITLSASNAGCSYNFTFTVSAISANDPVQFENIHMMCNMFDLNVTVLDTDGNPVNNAVVNARNIYRSSGTNGIYYFTGLTGGTFTVSANRTTATTTTQATCNGDAEITLDHSMSVTVILDSCCYTSTTYSECLSGYWDKTVSHSGTCEYLGTTVSRESCSLGESCWNCTVPITWSECIDGVFERVQNCTYMPTSTCNPNLPNPALREPCATTCNNGILNVGEGCDYYNGFFNISTTCLNQLRGFGIPNSAYIIENNLMSIICNPVTCACQPPVNTTPNVSNCTTNPGNTALTVTPIRMLPQFNLSWNWNIACTNNIEHLELRGCIGPQCDSGTDFPNSIDQSISTADPKSYLFNFIEPNTVYCFELTTIYNNTNTLVPNNVTVKCVTSGDIECLTGGNQEWCENNNVMECNASNSKIINRTCSATETCGIIDGEATCYNQGTCEGCNNFFGIYSYTERTLSDGTVCPTFLNSQSCTESGCYLDSSATTINKVYSCSNTLSCYDYYSEETCINDYCKKFTVQGINQCEWTSYSRNGEQNMFGKGVCRPKQESEQNCSLCDNTKSNKIYPECTADTCRLFGECYFEPDSEECIQKSQVTCNTYLDSWECIRSDNTSTYPGQNVSTNVTWDYTAAMPYKYQGTNVRINSTDGAERGVCRWTDDPLTKSINNNRNCFRDADNLPYISLANLSYGKDCVGNQSYRRICERDIIPPVTQINNKSSTYGLNMDLSDQVSVTDNSTWLIGDDEIDTDSTSRIYIKTYYCIAKGNNICYPTKTLSLSRRINLAESNISVGDDGLTLTMYYFSQDPAKNLEIPKSFRFRVDTTPPVITMLNSTISYPYSAYDWHTNLTIILRLDGPGPAICTFNLTPLRGDVAINSFKYNNGALYNIPSLINLNNVLLTPGSRVNTTYPGLVDGTYRYEWYCVDEFGNPSNYSQEIRIIGDVRINSPLPSENMLGGNVFRGNDSRYYNLNNNVFNINISVNTSNDAVCRYTTNPSYQFSYSQMENSLSVIPSKYHTSGISINNPSANNKIYEYYVGCNMSINNRYYSVYGTYMSNPIFSIDDIAPNSKIQYSQYNATGIERWLEYNDSTPPANYLKFRFECDDSSILLQTAMGINMTFGCDGQPYYCIEEAGVSGNKCLNMNTYTQTSVPIILDYTNPNPVAKTIYGNNPIVHLYSRDKGGNVPQHETIRTLLLRNTIFSDPNVTLYLNGQTLNGTVLQQNGTAITINSSLITISVEYNSEEEQYANIESIELLHLGGNIVLPLEAIDGRNGRTVYRFSMPFFDNGAYRLTINAIDDDTNIKNTTVNFRVAHANNTVWLANPRVGIGKTNPYSITVNTLYPSQCKYGFDNLSRCQSKACIFEDPIYTSFSITGNTTHIFTYTHTGTVDRMYVICRNPGMIDQYNDTAFVQTSFHAGYNDTLPVVNVTFVHKPYTKPEDNRIINLSYNTTIVRVFTDQPSVCTINSSNVRALLNIPEGTLFNNEHPQQYNRYYTVHNYTINYTGTGASIGIYYYTVNCTSLAQLSSTKGFTIDFGPYIAPPIVRIDLSESYLDLNRYNVTCQGLCMDTYQTNYSYVLRPVNASCSNLTIAGYTNKAPYIQLINVTNTTKICVIVFDILGRNATTEIIANVQAFNKGQMRVNYPYVYNYSSSSGIIDDHVYSPTQTFTLSISTEVAAECRYTTRENALRYTTDGDKFNAATPFSNTNSNTHTTDFGITATTNTEEVYAIVCRAANAPPNSTGLYITKQLYFYWDNTAPVTVVDVKPKIIIDWNYRDRVLFNITTDDDSRCVLDLASSKIRIYSGNNMSVVDLGTGTFALDSGSDINYTNYFKNRTRYYYLPNAWLNNLYLNATYDFSINCWNRARLYTTANASALYDLAKIVSINRTSATVFNGTIIPVNVTTNINSTCNITIDGNFGNVYQMSTRNNIAHNASINLGTGGSHTVDVACGVRSNANISIGHEIYTAIVDAALPVVLSLSTTTGGNFTCGLNGFYVNVAMSDDVGIMGFRYSVTPLAPTQVFVASGNNGLLFFNGTNGTLQENTPYTVTVNAIDMSGKASNASRIIITTRTTAGSMLCDESPPNANIQAIETPFLDIIRANITCTDDTGCRSTYNYSFTNRSDCTQETYRSRDSYNNTLQFMKSGLLCVKVLDLAGNPGYAQLPIRISVDMNNSMNITPLATNYSIYVYPNVLATSINPFNLSVTTSIDATCRYALTPSQNGTNITNLYNTYLGFNQTGGTLHTLYNFDTEGYEKYIDIICHSTVISTQPYSRKILRVIYTNVNPSINVSVKPLIVNDWNSRKSTITITTVPETWCIISSTGNTDTWNTPSTLGDPDDALTYKTTYVTEFSYEQLSNPGIFDYDINCWTLGNRHNSTSIRITYNISNTLTINLISDPIQRNRTAEVSISTNLLSQCNLTWNNVYRGIMTPNVSAGQYYTRIITTTDGEYVAKVDCITPVTSLRAIAYYNITVNTTRLPPPCDESIGGIACDKEPPTITITTIPTPFLDIIRANITCTDDIGCTTTFNYSYTNRSDCTQETYNRRESYNNLLTINKTGTLCIKALDQAGKIGYAQRTINIYVNLNNSLNITPITNNETIYINPNTLTTTRNPFNLAVSTSIDATCKYSKTAYNSSNLANLYNMYLNFNQTGNTIHTIYNFDTGGYEQYIDIICHSTIISTQPYSRKILRVIYTNIDPIINVSVTPNLITDWNELESTITINTIPETRCTITNTQGIDTWNTPTNLGTINDATTYKTTHTTTFTYQQQNTPETFNYNI
ncbi:MAG: carboxypeptidase-like regulatory domain-containing protein, partial [Candidatus Woesearchaeota archaeon]